MNTHQCNCGAAGIGLRHLENCAALREGDGPKRVTRLVETGRLLGADDRVRPDLPAEKEAVLVELRRLEDHAETTYDPAAMSPLFTALKRFLAKELAEARAPAEGVDIMAKEASTDHVRALLAYARTAAARPAHPFHDRAKVLLEASAAGPIELNSAIFAAGSPICGTPQRESASPPSAALRFFAEAYRPDDLCPDLHASDAPTTTMLEAATGRAAAAHFVASMQVNDLGEPRGQLLEAQRHQSESALSFFKRTSDPRGLGF